MCSDFGAMDAQFKQSGKFSVQEHNAADSGESLYMGIQITKIPNLVQFANTQSYISKNTVPFFIMNGSEDPIIPTEQGENFANANRQFIGYQFVIDITSFKVENSRQFLIFRAG
ncbi:hypothetical protein ACWIW6_02210 [Ursidibacter sp. B-7004-1]